MSVTLQEIELVEAAGVELLNSMYFQLLTRNAEAREAQEAPVPPQSRTYFVRETRAGYCGNFGLRSMHRNVWKTLSKHMESNPDAIELEEAILPALARCRIATTDARPQRHQQHHGCQTCLHCHSPLAVQGDRSLAEIV
ncbi:MAG TPA: hypothetical protein VM557_11485 [Thermoanaerobaculia bacterium]|nr:hypothetical protein [Thermoanaerobaculia bacterium]